MTEQTVNKGTYLLQRACLATDTVLYLQGTFGLPNTGTFSLRMGSEIVTVTGTVDHVGNSVNVTRAEVGLAQAQQIGTALVPCVTARSLAQMQFDALAQSNATLAVVNNTTGPYTAKATDLFIEVDLSGGPLTGSINLGTNALPMKKVVVSDSKWLVDGATKIIPVTGGAIPIQDPSTGAFVTGTVVMKGAGQVTTWMYDGAKLVLAA